MGLEWFAVRPASDYSEATEDAKFLRRRLAIIPPGTSSKLPSNIVAGSGFAVKSNEKFLLEPGAVEMPTKLNVETAVFPE